MSDRAAAVPYEKQGDPQTNRGCGAACLSMVYRSFGKPIAQAEIWPAIAKENRFGSLASTTHLMTQDALNRGFAAMAIQARHPLQVLRICREQGIRGILNHRLQTDAPTGHYSVLIDIDDKNVLIHDPFFGPSRSLSYPELLELWQPRFRNSEIVGNLLIGIARQPPALPACPFCHAPFPAAVACPRCMKPVGLLPGVLLGCMNDSCIARMWNCLCCPACDCTWHFTIGPPQTGEAPSSPVQAAMPPAAPPGVAGGASAPDTIGLDRLFAEIDKFSSLALTLPAASKDPAIKQQIDFLVASKNKIKLARAEALAHRQMLRGQMTKLQEATQAKLAAHQQRLEDLNKPAEPLDGQALGCALLKNLGFIS